MAQCLSSSQSEQRDEAEGEREWELSFLRSPVEFIADSNHSNRVSAIRMEINQLEVLHACSGCPQRFESLSEVVTFKIIVITGDHERLIQKLSLYLHMFAFNCLPQCFQTTLQYSFCSSIVLVCATPTQSVQREFTRFKIAFGTPNQLE